jgi:hypothetical protein
MVERLPDPGVVINHVYDTLAPVAGCGPFNVTLITKKPRHAKAERTELSEIRLFGSFSAPVRFSIAWYTVRVLGFLSRSLVLIVLLYEITTLYARLLEAVLAQRREREARLMTGDLVAVQQHKAKATAS